MNTSRFLVFLLQLNLLTCAEQMKRRWKHPSRGESRRAVGGQAHLIGQSMSFNFLQTLWMQLKLDEFKRLAVCWLCEKSEWCI